jgi:hypothetical protein
MAKQTSAANDEGAPPADPAARQLADAVGRAVMAGLGRPGDLLNVTVRRVAGSNYRVNVVTGADPTQARIAHSFFVSVDDQGNVLDSSPPLARCY